MTSIVEANEKIAQCFVDAWAPTGFDFSLENEKYEAQGTEPWARFSSRLRAASQETHGRPGHRKFERSGSAFVQIFVDTDTGTQQAKTLAKLVADAFEGQRITGTTVRFNDVIPRETGPDGKWYQTVVEINFVFDETR